MGEIQVRGPFIPAVPRRGVGRDKFTSEGWLRTGRGGMDELASCAHRPHQDLIKSGGE